MSAFTKIEHTLTQITITVAFIGGLGLIFATFITCVSILLKILRRLLDGLFAHSFETPPWEFIRPLLGEEELVTYSVGLALYCALPWVMLQKGHITVNLFENFFPKRVNQLLDFLGDVGFAIIAYLILSRQWFLIFRKARRSEEPFFAELFSGNFGVLAERLRDSHQSQIIGFPLWPTYIVAEICVFLFFIVALFCVFRSLRTLYRGGLYA